MNHQQPAKIIKTWDVHGLFMGEWNIFLMALLVNKFIDYVGFETPPGTGSLGIEALSRGASECIYVWGPQRKMALLFCVEHQRFIMVLAIRKNIT